MADVLPDDLQSPSVKRFKVEAEKGILDLPLNLMHEVFGPLDARSLLETAKSHDTLRKNVMDWPDKRWEIVHLSTVEAIIDYETFDRKEADILLENAEYKEEKAPKGAGTSTNICDLPYELLWPIMETLEWAELLQVAKCHPNLLQATRNLTDKWFDLVNVMPHGVTFMGFFPMRMVQLTHIDADILLTGAEVEEVKYDLQTNVTPVASVRTLVIQGDEEDGDKCVGLIEKWKPHQVVFPEWNSEAFNSIPELPRVLKDVNWLEFSALPVEWLSYIPDWKFTSLKTCLDAEGKNVTPQLQSLFQKLHDQWVAGERGLFYISILIGSGMIDSFEVADRATRPESVHVVERPGAVPLKWGCEMRTMLTPPKPRFYMDSFRR